MKTLNSRPPIERMRLIARKLRVGERFNAQSLSGHLEVTSKTIHRDLEFLRDRLAYDFEFDHVSNSYRLLRAPKPEL